MTSVAGTSGAAAPPAVSAKHRQRRTLTYTLRKDTKKNTKVGRALSRTPRAKVDFEFKSSGSVFVAVGVRLDYNGMVGFDASTSRTITTGAEIPFYPLKGSGRKAIRTSMYYAKWGLDERTTHCAPASAAGTRTRSGPRSARRT